MTIPQEDCSHATLQFHSGDYYLACRACNARWAMLGRTTSQGEYLQPEAANKGIGATLSGQLRAAQS